MRLATKHNNLQELYHNLQIEFTKSEIEKANLRQIIKDLQVSLNNAKYSFDRLNKKIINSPEEILYHIKLSKIENYVRKVKLKKINSKF